MNTFRSLWAAEPVRTAVYAAVAAVLTALVAFGVIDDKQSAAVAAVVTAVAAVATEVARSQVYSPKSVETATPGYESVIPEKISDEPLEPEHPTE